MLTSDKKGIIVKDMNEFVKILVKPYDEIQQERFTLKFAEADHMDAFLSRCPAKRAHLIDTADVLDHLEMVGLENLRPWYETLEIVRMLSVLRNPWTDERRLYAHACGYGIVLKKFPDGSHLVKIWKGALAPVLRDWRTQTLSPRYVGSESLVPHLHALGSALQWCKTRRSKIEGAITTYKHGDPVHDKRGKVVGSWMVCRRCGAREALFGETPQFQGWLDQICPNCKTSRDGMRLVPINPHVWEQTLDYRF